MPIAGSIVFFVAISARFGGIPAHSEVSCIKMRGGGGLFHAGGWIWLLGPKKAGLDEGRVLESALPAEERSFPA